MEEWKKLDGKYSEFNYLSEEIRKSQETIKTYTELSESVESAEAKVEEYRK